MEATLSAMEARQQFGEILNRVNLVHDRFIVERNGKPLAAIIPVSMLQELQATARKQAIEFLKFGPDAEISDKEAMQIANQAKKESRAQ